MSLRRVILPMLILLAAAAPALADDPTTASLQTAINSAWVLLAAFLVFFMQAGFTLVEAGFTRTKNTCNIVAKNFIDYCVASIMFFLFGYAIMFGKGNSLFGLTGFFMSDPANPSSVPVMVFWLFQAAFCGTTATIVSGAMAERMKFGSYLVYTAMMSGLIYPIIGHWAWGGGWLAGMGFADFAGSTVVHACGGSVALVGAYVLGPRIGKYASNGQSKAIPGHNIPMAALGVLILWFGWFGFNPGSTIGIGDTGFAVGLIAANTNLAAAAGALAAMTVIWMISKKPDVSMMMNGALAGLVAITAPCAYVTPMASIVIGLIAGVIVVYGVLLLDKLRIDDPVGAVPVHCMCGVFGTVAVGLWGQTSLPAYGIASTGLGGAGLFAGGGVNQLITQLVGTLSIAGFSAACMFGVFTVMKMTIGLRVSESEEIRGLDIDEHGMQAYPDFQNVPN